MKKTLSALAVIALLGISMVPTLGAAAKAGHKAPAKSTPKKVSAVCPVMGTKIPDVSKAAGKSVYKGKTYYFCCNGCKPQFDKNPQKYIKK
jgi:YHS domain-containing protein